MSLIDGSRRINSCSFTMDFKEIVISTSIGIEVYCSQTLKQLMPPISFAQYGGVIVCKKFSQAFALVTASAPKRLLIYSDTDKKIIAKIPFERGVIHNIYFSAAYIIVSLDEKIYIYTTTDECKLVASYVTSKLGGIFSTNDRSIVYPDIDGNITIAHIGASGRSFKLSNFSSITHFSCLALDWQGERLAVVSSDGKTILIMSIKTEMPTILQTLYRGSKVANLCSLMFNKRGDHLLCSSDSGTVHIFATTTIDDVKCKYPSSAKNYTSLLSFIYPHEYSFTKFTIPTAGKHLASFSSTDGENIFTIVCHNGNIYSVRYTLDGKCEILNCNLIVK